MSLKAIIQGASAGATAATVLPEGVDFDGTYDYLSRNTDLTGNVDSKTFTFSAWVYRVNTLDFYIYGNGASSLKFYIRIDNGNLRIYGRNISNVAVIDTDMAVGSIPINTFVHILFSFDLSNSVNRSVYINDKLTTAIWNTYANDTIDCTNADHLINEYNLLNKKRKSRISNIFLDYTYRDLSIEANRRLFITADGKPADWNTTKALNGILMMQMKDASTAHINDGTGGNFVQNGTLATADRGANQDNCVASYFDGVADYLSRISLTGVADGKQFTLSFSFNYKIATGGSALTFHTADGQLIRCIITNNSFDIYVFSIANTTLAARVSAPINIFGLNTNHSIFVSFDLTDINKRNCLIDNNPVGTWSDYVNVTIPISTCNAFYLASYNGIAAEYTRNLGELYFDTKYIDLATSNPFWDSISNKPKPVRQVIRETGVTPLIAMPLDASNAGKNYGTGGDFTVNSGPYVGARGASEVWQRTAKFDGSTSYLSSTGLAGIIDTKTLTFVSHVYKTASTLYRIVGCTNSNVSISIDASNQLVITAKNTAGTTILSATVTTAIANTTWTSILLSIDLSNTANRSIYLNGVLASVTWTTYTNDTIDFTNASWVVGADISLGNKYNGTIALMIDNTYIDFTSEINRLKYIDGLSYPLSINTQIAKGIIAKPALYLAFEDTSNLGLNSGYGGNLTVNGTVTAGADVLG